MYCPECRGEFREGFTRCDDCGVDLVHELPSEDHEAPDFVKVFETSEPDVIPVIKSVLEGAGIPYLVEGEDLMNLFPSEMLGGIYKPSAEVRFHVTAAQEEAARQLLTAHLEAFADEASAASLDDPQPDSDDS